MKTICLSGLMLVLCFASAGAQEKLLTTDPLTGLPLIPATDPGFQLGNAPSRLPDAMFCKSKMQVDKKGHGYANNRSQDSFYKPDGTVVVSITGQRAEDGQNADGYSVS